MKPRVGFMGLGIMGRAMAANVMGAGYPLTVFNRTRERAKPLADKGAKVAASPKDLADESRVIVAMVTGPEAINSLLFGPGGCYEALGGQKTFINMSTVSPAYTRGLERRIALTEAAFVDAPVAGTKKPAEDGTLIIMAAGDESRVKEVTPLLETMGQKVVFCGEAGQGSMMKMAVNLLLGAMMEGFSEVLNFGIRGGLSLEAMLDVILAGPLGSGLFQVKSQMIIDDDFPVNFPLKHMAKDLKFVSDTAFETGAAVPVGHTILGLYRQGMAKGLGNEDFAAIFRVLEGMGGG